MDHQLKPGQNEAISLLLSGATVAAVARELNIDRGTIYNWCKHLLFSYALTKARAHHAQIISDGILDLPNPPSTPSANSCCPRKLPPPFGFGPRNPCSTLQLDHLYPLRSITRLPGKQSTTPESRPSSDLQHLKFNRIPQSSTPRN